VAKLKGFGEKTQQKILEGIEFLSEVAGRVRLDKALPIGEAIVAALRDAPGVARIELGGSLRRRRETIKDVHLLVGADGPPGPIMERFVKLPGVRRITGQGDTKSSVIYASPDGRVTLNVDLRVVADAQFPYALQHFSGSKEHNVSMRGRAQARGFKM